MIRLYFDTETTGFPRKADAPIETCPHVVQLAAVLMDDDTPIASFSTRIRPMGLFVIPEDVAAIHGITTEMAERTGVPIAVAMAVFQAFTGIAEEAVAHNIEFDAKILAYEYERAGIPNRLALLPQVCTMKATTDLCKLPGRYGTYKWPKLIEAHQHIFGEGFDGAHDALADVLACARVHRWLVAQAEPATPPQASADDDVA